MYAIALALVALYPDGRAHVLQAVFAASILWHVDIVRRRGMTPHHALAVAANALGVLLTRPKTR